jgi:hypothetical protein
VLCGLAPSTTDAELWLDACFERITQDAPAVKASDWWVYEDQTEADDDRTLYAVYAIKEQRHDRPDQ